MSYQIDVILDHLKGFVVLPICKDVGISVYRNALVEARRYEVVIVKFMGEGSPLIITGTSIISEKYPILYQSSRVELPLDNVLDNLQIHEVELITAQIRELLE